MNCESPAKYRSIVTGLYFKLELFINTNIMKNWFRVSSNNAKTVYHTIGFIG